MDEGSGRARHSWLQIDGLPGIEAVVITLALLLAAGTFVEPLHNSESGRLALRVVLALIYLASFVLLTRQRGTSWLPWLIRHQPLLVFVIGLAFASAIWSYDPAATGRGALHLLGATAVGVLIGFAFRPSEMMRILFWVFIIMVAINAVAVIVTPEVAQTEVWRADATTTGWQGLVENKNRLGSLATIALILFLSGTLGKRIDAAWGAALALLSAMVLGLSQAATSYVAAATGVGVLAWFVLMRRFQIPIALAAPILFIGVAGAIYLSVAHIGVFTDLLGREETLTQRTIVWQDARAIIAERPWLGHGVGVVWGLGEYTWLPDFKTTARVVHAHNGYLDIATELGIVGAAAAGAQIIVVLYQCLLLLSGRASAFALFGFAYVLAFAVFNLGEVSLYQPYQPEWMVFVALSVATARAVASNPPRGFRGSGRRARASASSSQPKGLRAD